MNSRLTRWQFATLLLLVVGYAGCYLCRSNFPVCVELIKDTLIERGYEPREAAQMLGTIASAGVLAYALGKFFTGTLADFLGGRRNVLVGMFGSVLFTLLFAVSGTVPLFTLAIFGNRLWQSLCWTGTVKIVGKWFSYASYGSAMGVISLSYLFGDAAARWFMGRLLDAGFSWRGVFATCGASLLLLVIANFLWLKESPRAIHEGEPPGNPDNVFAETDVDTRPASVKELLLGLLQSWQFLVACLLSLGLTLLRETFNQWPPAYFSDVLHSTPGEAADQSALFPLLGGASVLLAGWLGDRLGPSGRAGVIVAGCAGTCGVLLALGTFDLASSSWSPVWLVGLLGFLMIGPYSYLAGAISLDLGGKQGGATACGIIDGVGYLGAIMAGDTVTRLRLSHGWGPTFQSLAVVAALTSLAAIGFWRLQFFSTHHEHRR